MVEISVDLMNIAVCFGSVDVSIVRAWEEGSECHLCYGVTDRLPPKPHSSCTSL